MQDSEIKHLLGLKIKKLRENLNLSQEELSEFLGITQRQVSMIERGLSFPKLATLNRLTKVLRCELSYLFDYEYLVSEQTLKTKLKQIIENNCYENNKVLFIIARNL